MSEPRGVVRGICRSGCAPRRCNAVKHFVLQGESPVQAMATIEAHTHTHRHDDRHRMCASVGLTSWPAAGRCETTGFGASRAPRTRTKCDHGGAAPRPTFPPKEPRNFTNGRLGLVPGLLKPTTHTLYPQWVPFAYTFPCDKAQPMMPRTTKTAPTRESPHAHEQCYEYDAKACIWARLRSQANSSDAGNPHKSRCTKGCKPIRQML